MPKLITNASAVILFFVCASSNLYSAEKTFLENCELNKKVWLSGSRGFVGKYLKDFLINEGYNIESLSYSDLNDEVIKIDFSRKEDVEELILKKGIPDIFIHLGWGNVYEPHKKIHVLQNILETIKT